MMRIRLAAALVGLMALTGCGTTPDHESARTAAGSGGDAGAVEYSHLAPAQPTSDLPTILVEALPPGSDDRGARRTVGGDDGSRFFTADHHSSFREVVSG